MSFSTDAVMLHYLLSLCSWQSRCTFTDVLPIGYCSYCTNSILQSESNRLFVLVSWLGAPFRSAIIIEFEMTWCYFGCLRRRYSPPAKSCPPSNPISRRGGARHPRRHDGSRLPVRFRSLRWIIGVYPT